MAGVKCLQRSDYSSFPREGRSGGDLSGTRALEASRSQERSRTKRVQESADRVTGSSAPYAELRQPNQKLGIANLPTRCDGSPRSASRIGPCPTEHDERTKDA